MEKKLRCSMPWETRLSVRCCFARLSPAPPTNHRSFPLVEKKKAKKDTSSDLRKKKKERMLRKKMGLPSDDEEEL
jgi:hypothetical protein